MGGLVASWRLKGVANGHSKMNQFVVGRLIEYNLRVHMMAMTRGRLIVAYQYSQQQPLLV